MRYDAEWLMRHTYVEISLNFRPSERMLESYFSNFYYVVLNNNNLISSIDFNV